MKIRFYPRDIGRYRTGEYIFSQFAEPPFRDFASKLELVKYLVQMGVKVDDSEYPLTFEKCDHHVFGKDTIFIKQWTIQGWAKEL